MINGDFVKMHGLGNDFVIIDCRDTPLEFSSAKARHIADRNRGIGCDQLILLKSSTVADVRMVIYNSNGGEVESCGNASRCVVALLGKDCSIETGGGIIRGRIADNGVTIDMGLARFGWQDIPLAFAMDTAALPLAWEELSAPMAVIIETDAAFPQRINVNVASVKDGQINLLVWERGVGLTQACGTGACATAVAAIKQGLVTSPVTVNLPGGALSIDWHPDAPIIMAGGTSFVFSGTADWDDFG
jgi:diaminopimelate epimerase